MAKLIFFLGFACHAAVAKVLHHQCEEVEDSTRSTNLLQLRSKVLRVSNKNEDTTYVASTKIPCFIHQTWKTNDMSELDGWMRESVLSFQDHNPECKHKIWSDAEVEEFMKKNYPELAEAWPTLKPVERADLFRYAVVHTLGGFYADMDVNCLKPLKEWHIPDDTELVVGYETGWHLKEDTRHHVGFSRNEQLEQWLFGAAPGHPALQKCLELFQKKRQWGIEETTELTGPALFSDAIHEYFWSSIANNTGKSIGEAETALQLQQRDTEEMKFPPGRGPEGSHVLILSANQVAAPGFSAGLITENLLIRHMFKGTWKPPGHM